MYRSVAGRGLDVLQGWVDTARWLDAAATEFPSGVAITHALTVAHAAVNHVSGDSAGGGLGVRQRWLGATGSSDRPRRRIRSTSIGTLSACGGAGSEHLHDDQAGVELGVREWRLGATRFAARADRDCSRAAAHVTVAAHDGLRDAGSVRRNGRRRVRQRQLGAEGAPTRWRRRHVTRRG